MAGLASGQELSIMSKAKGRDLVMPVAKSEDVFVNVPLHIAPFIVTHLSPTLFIDILGVSTSTFRSILHCLDAQQIGQHILVCHAGPSIESRAKGYW